MRSDCERPRWCTVNMALSVLVEKIIDQPRRRRVDAGRLFEVRQPRPRHRLGGAEGLQQRPLARGADSGDFVERALHEFLLALGAMRADGETMRLVAQSLHEKQRRVALR